MGLGGGGAGTIKSCSLSARNDGGFDEMFSVRLAYKSLGVTICRLLRPGEIGTGMAG